MLKVPNINTNLKNHPVSMPIEAGSIRNPFIIPGLKKVSVESQLNPNYCFDNFVEGDCNRLARSAGYAVAQKPGGTAFNTSECAGGSEPGDKSGGAVDRLIADSMTPSIDGLLLEAQAAIIRRKPANPLFMRSF